jgi:hypothetical protein
MGDPSQTDSVAAYEKRVALRNSVWAAGAGLIVIGLLAFLAAGNAFGRADAEPAVAIARGANGPTFARTPAAQKAHDEAMSVAGVGAGFVLLGIVTLLASSRVARSKDPDDER